MTFFELDASPMRELMLAAGTSADMPAMQAWIAAMPADAYGVVLIESDDAIERLQVPAGVAVNRVPLGLEPGEGLSRAVTAWLDEWLWAESDVDRTLQLWSGDHHEPAMRDCWARVDRRIARGHFARGISEVVPERV